MTQIIIHIGHQKTGSSYLQSVLAFNHEKLHNDFYYPFHKSFAYASKGYISSGNGSLLTLQNMSLNNHKKILFSGEQLFVQLQEGKIDFFKNLCSKYNVKVILYSRNVIEYFFSQWGQAVKRGGATCDFESAVLSNLDGHHTYFKIIKWMELSDSLGFELIIRNYSNHKNHLLDLFIRDVTGGDDVKVILSPPSVSFVNRSLSPVELEFQRVFNFLDKKSGKYISDVLVNDLPEIRAAKPFLSERLFNTISEKISPILYLINNRLDASEVLVVGDYEDYISGCSDYDDGSKFSLEQIEVLGKSIINEFGDVLSIKNNVDNLRDIAIKIESGSKLTKKDAILLMKIAQKLSPDGSLIAKKLNEWSALCDD